ncbi:hypothetical protein QYE76_005153 [Lolium multiflorum]|uniref:DUF4283 domain-containing protein n=1 Tax=Lolium multiflorum TaxID=4521 RepID=A0AAD8RS35_LOLMU|nr:hypothetical protein QYE76_005153 [Lolium multiflorum]
MDKQLLPPAGARERDQVPHTPPVLEVPEIPLLSVGLQAMSLADQGQQQQSNEEEQEKYTLILKIACSGGAPKIISLNSVQQAMTRAWRSNFYKVTQVNQFIFKAHFISFEAIMFVFTRQPWTVGSDVMMIEFESPGKDIQKGDYKFEFIYVNVRAYGIPKKYRSFKILKDILNLVGTPSEFHELRQVMLESRSDYIWGIAKIRVSAPIYDQVKLLYSVNEVGFTYLSYEKIGRICLFCGVMFHTVGNCHLRQKIVASKIQSGQADQAQQVPFQRYGSWIVEPADIPSSVAAQGQGCNTSFNNYQIPQIGRFQGVSESNPSGQRANEESNAAVTRRRLQFHEKSSAMAEEQRQEERTVHPPNYIDGGNQREGSALISDRLHGGRVGGTVDATLITGQSMLQNYPGGNDISGGPGTVMQQGQLSPADSLGLTSLPYPLEEEAHILENLGRTVGHSLLLGQQQQQHSTDKMGMPGQNNRIFGPSSSTPDTIHQHDHTGALGLMNEPLQFANTYQIPQATSSANLHSAMDPSAQMSTVAPPNSHRYIQPNPAIPIPNPQLSPGKSPPKRLGASLDLPLSPAPKRAATAQGQDGQGRGADLKAMQIPVGGAGGAQGKILFTQAPPPAVGASSVSGVGRDGGGGNGALSAAAVLAEHEPGRGGGILGARPSNAASSTPNPNPAFSTTRGRTRRRPSGWDIQENANTGAGHGAVGFTYHKPGSSTWRRVRKPEEMAMGSLGGRGAASSLGILGAGSNCPSPALSSVDGGAGNDTWQLHTPSPSQSVASQDSRHGGFSPPPMARDYYVGLDDRLGYCATEGQENVQGQVQLGTSSDAPTRVVCDDSGRASMDMDLEAAAPALKAPRAP